MNHDYGLRRHARRSLLLAIAVAAGGSFAAGFANGAPPESADPSWGLLRGGTVVLLRRADASGVGDPPNFVLGDCSTQRNLDAAGRATRA